MAVDQVAQKTHLRQTSGNEVSLCRKQQKTFKLADALRLKSAYQVNGFVIQVVFQSLLELSDHGLHKLPSKVVVPGVQQTH